MCNLPGYMDTSVVLMRVCSALVLVKRTRGVDGYPVNASVLCLELLQEDSHAVAERLEGELTALSPGRQTD